MAIIRVPPQDPVLAQNAQLNLGGLVSAANSAAAIGAAHAAAGKGMVALAQETMAMFKPEQKETDIRHRILQFKQDYAKKSNEFYANTVDSNGNPIYDYTPGITNLLQETAAMHSEGLTGKDLEAYQMQIDTFSNGEIIQSINKSSQAQQGVAIQDTTQLIQTHVADFATGKLNDELFEKQLEHELGVLGRNGVPPDQIMKMRENAKAQAHESRVRNALDQEQFDVARKLAEESPYLDSLQKVQINENIDTREAAALKAVQDNLKKQGDLVVEMLGQGYPISKESLKAVEEAARLQGMSEEHVKFHVENAKSMGEFSKLNPEMRQEALNQLTAKAAAGDENMQKQVEEYRKLHESLVKAEKEDPVGFQIKKGNLKPEAGRPLDLNKGSVQEIEQELLKKAELGKAMESLIQQGKASKESNTSGLTATDLASLSDAIEKGDPQKALAIMGSLNKVYGDKAALVYQDMYQNATSKEAHVLALAGLIAQKGNPVIAGQLLEYLRGVKEGRIDAPTNNDIMNVMATLSSQKSFQNISNAQFRQDLAALTWALAHTQASHNADPAMLQQLYQGLTSKIDVDIEGLYQELNPSTGIGEDPWFGSQDQIAVISDGRSPEEVIEKSTPEQLAALNLTPEVIADIEEGLEYKLQQTGPNSYTIITYNPNSTPKNRSKANFDAATNQQEQGKVESPLIQLPEIPKTPAKKVDPIGQPSVYVPPSKAASLSMAQLNTMPVPDRLSHVWSLVQQAFPDNPAMQQVAMGMAINEVGLTQGKLGNLSTQMNSLFNIKDPKRGKHHNTIEYNSAGQAYSDTSSKWAYFNNLGESVQHFKGYINRKLGDKQYGSVESILNEIKRIGYATDPAYNDKVRAAINNHVAPLIRNKPIVSMYSTEPSVKASLPIPGNASDIKFNIPNSSAAAMASISHYISKVPNRDYYIYVDWNASETSNRMHVVDARSGKILTSVRTSHGIGSGRGDIPTTFKNVSGSLNSPIGAMMITADQSAASKFSTSFRLEGLEKGINDKVSSRAVTLHSMPGLGKSEGCFGIPEADLMKLKPYLKAGTLIYAQSNYATIKSPADYEASIDRAPEAVKADVADLKFQKNKDFYNAVDDIGEVLYSSAKSQVEGVPFNFQWRTNNKAGIDCIEGARRVVLNTMKELGGYDLKKMDKLLTGVTNDVYTKVSKVAGSISHEDILRGNVTPGTMLFVRRKEPPAFAKNRPDQISHSAVVIAKNGELYVSNQGGKAGTIVPYQEWIKQQQSQKDGVDRFFGTNPFIIK